MFALLFILSLAQAQLSPTQLYVKGYSDKAYAQYSLAVSEAKKLDVLVDDFLAEPSLLKLELAKNQWIEARKAYLPTEIYRFFDSPIDDADGPEGMLNAWPIDEAYMDSVLGQKNSGIINDLQNYPQLTKDILLSLNEKDGETNISTGWHAIEFLLWGQDFSVTGPGNRPFTDYLDGSAPNANRRRQYLALLTDLLVEQLTSVRDEWNPQRSENYYAAFVQSPDSLNKLVEALRFFSGEELSVERIWVAYDKQNQENEHSCFSDTTHNDLYFDFLGIQGAILDSYNGVTLISLIAQKNAVLAGEMKAQLASLELALRQFPAPFDQAIFNPESRKHIKGIVDGLQILAEQIEQSKSLL